MPLQIMSPITYGPAGYQAFVIAFNNDIRQLNQLISYYNDYYHTLSHEEKIRALTDVIEIRQRIQDTYHEKYVNNFPEVLAIQEKLFTDIQQEFNALGRNNLSGIINPRAPQESNAFSDILNNMAPEKVNQLIGILSKGGGFNRHALSTLYKPGENPAFEQFIATHAISYLGGSNSKNFKITPPAGIPYVLKIENRLGLRKLPVAHLQDPSLPSPSLNSVLTPIMAERQGTLVDADGTKITRTALVTEFCAGSDVETHSKKHGKNIQQRTEAALSIYDQMLTALLTIEGRGCAFSDMKNTNWLVDEHGKLLIADTKGFLFTEPNGTLTPDIVNIGGGWARSASFITPEMNSMSSSGISVDPMHAHMFGKNLYQYLTACNECELASINHFSQMNFNYPIFQTEEGKKLAALIKDTVQYKPHDRISLQTASGRLNEIRLNVEQKKILLYMAELRLITNDKNIEQYLNNLEQWANLNKDVNLLKTAYNEVSLQLQYAIENKKQELRVQLARLKHLPSMKPLIDRAENALNTSNNSKRLVGIQHELYQAEQDHIQQKQLENRSLLTQIQAHIAEIKDPIFKAFIDEQDRLLIPINDLQALEEINRTLKKGLQDLVFNKKKALNTLLNEIQVYVPTSKNYVSSQARLIDTTNDLSKLNQINQELQQIIGPSIEGMKKENLALLNELTSHIHLADAATRNLIDEQHQNLVNVENNTREIAKINANLNALLTRVMNNKKQETIAILDQIARQFPHMVNATLMQKSKVEKAKNLSTLMPLYQQTKNKLDELNYKAAVSNQRKQEIIPPKEQEKSSLNQGKQKATRPRRQIPEAPIQNKAVINQPLQPVNERPNRPTIAQQKTANLSILNRINTFRFGKRDTEMNQFVKEKTQLINKTNDPQELDRLQEALHTVLLHQQATREVKRLVNHFRNNAGVFTIGMNDKADRIEQAMRRIPVEQRNAITDETSYYGRPVHQAIASHRHFTLFRREPGNKIDVASAAKSYGEFKKHLSALKSDNNLTNEIDLEQPPGQGRKL